MRVVYIFGVASLGAGCDALASDPLGGRYGGESTLSPAPSAGSPYGVGGSEGGNGSGGASGAGSASGGRGGGAPGTHDAGATTASDAGLAIDASFAGGSDGATTSAPPAAPTWSELHVLYFAPGTIGDCTSCHDEMSTPAGAYAWLEQQGELDSLDDPNASILSWYGGGMPKHGPADEPQAVADIDAWAAAGRFDD